MRLSILINKLKAIVMLNFELQNPTKILFGKGQIAQIAKEIPADARILLTYGGGSIKTNGVYEQVQKALAGRTYIVTGKQIGRAHV